jgi:hypothetical protein
MIIHNIRAWEAFNNVSYERELLDSFDQDDPGRKQKYTFSKERMSRYARQWTAPLPRNREVEKRQGLCVGCCGAPRPYEFERLGEGAEPWLVKFEDLVRLNVDAEYKECILEMVGHMGNCDLKSGEWGKKIHEVKLAKEMATR